MDWDAIGAIGELLGSIAVFVTLVYLAIQIRQARSEARRAMSQGRMEANRALLQLDLDERHLAARLSEQAIFDTAVQHRMRSNLARLLWDQHFKHRAHADVVRYLERTLDG